MDLGLEGKVALVTGAATGIGKGCADMLAENGATVIYSDRNADRVAEAARGMGEPLRLDVADRTGISAAVGTVLDRHGQIDILVNNAGIGVRAEDRKSIEDFPEKAWDDILAIDLTGLFLVSRAVTKGMKARRSGAIVNIASVLGIVPLRLQSPYVAAKAAVINLTRSMAIELATDGIRVNAVAPGSCATETWQAWMDDPLSQADGLKEQQLATIPMKRAGTLREMGQSVAFLSSDAASYITGHTLVVDGGWTAGYARDW
jgi:NAD(P)-dependent dehydrogenase (short-subunit alcohol dehydrogenase family)